MVDYIKNSSSNYKSCNSWLPCISLHYKSINFTIHHTLKNNSKKLVRLQQENTNINNLIGENVVRFIYAFHPFTKKGKIIAVTGVILFCYLVIKWILLIMAQFIICEPWIRTDAKHLPALEAWELDSKTNLLKQQMLVICHQKKTQTDQWSILTEIKANQAAVLAMLWDKWCEQLISTT